MAASEDKSEDKASATTEPSREPQNVRATPGPSSRFRSQRSPSPSQPPKRSSTAPVASAPGSLGTSPRTSREPSPTRPSALKLQHSNNNTRLTRPRKGSQDLSPQRTPNVSAFNIPTTPSAAAIQRALSAAGTPRLSSTVSSDALNDQHRVQKQIRGGVPVNTSRVRSPPRSASLNQPSPFPSHTNDLEPPPTPSIIVNHPTPKSASSFGDSGGEEEDMLRAGLRSPVRDASGSRTLEAVQESSLPETPAIGTSNKIAPPKASGVSWPTAIAATILEDAPSKPGALSTESGSDSGGNKSVKSMGATDGAKDTKKPSTVQPAAKPPMINPRRSFSQLSTSKNKIASEGARNMTVETETVNSAPQTAVGGVSERSIMRTESGSTVRPKPSTETIKPKKEKKEKKKTVRKAPSITSGTASSKADIFEARVASAVDEANSSDSEETFVYESNPAENVSRPGHRFHSRTPSVASTVSQLDHYGARYRSDGHNSLMGKKSMKFANSHHHNGQNGDGENASSKRNAGSVKHHHIGRHGRTPGHVSILDNESPFPNTGKPLRSPASANRRASPRPHTPRSPHLRMPVSSKSISANYELEADDERTPLLPPSRIVRTRNSRRPLGRHDEYYYGRERGFWRGMGGCVLLGGLVSLLIAVIVMALVLCSKPLVGVQIKNIENVLASDQEIIFDLYMHAINPNLVSIQVNDLDILIYAKSKYVGMSSHWRYGPMLPGVALETHKGRKSSSRLARPNGTDYRKHDGVDEGTDPIEEGPHVMLLGQIFKFDSPLIFEASPFERRPSFSTGEVRLAKPGNRTEKGESDVWEDVILHPFDLIVRGIVKYTLPTSSNVLSTEIHGRVTVTPEEQDNNDEEEDEPSDRVDVIMIGASTTPEIHDENARLAVAFEA